MPLIETKGAASAQGFGEFAKTGVATYIEDVFSTYLYTGNDSTQTISNGIDESGKGAMTWIKCRSTSTRQAIYDTVRGATKQINANETSAQSTNTDGLQSFTSTGFTVGPDSAVNASAFSGGGNYASWTFRKQPKFFDIVTYTGSGGTQAIAHNLGSVPGCIIIKAINSTEDWNVYHRSTGATTVTFLNLTNAAAYNANFFPTEPTSTEFYVGDTVYQNAEGSPYIAYLFAHNAGGFGLTGTDDVISCGSVTNSGGSQYNDVSLGWEPQWLLVKNATGTSTAYWQIVDNMRGLTNNNVSTAVCNTLRANAANAESNPGNLQITATGFRYYGTSYSNGDTLIYIAIRRGPMKVPTSGTSVFSPVAETPSGSANYVMNSSSGFPVDMLLYKERNNVATPYLTNRLTNNYLQTASTAAEASYTYGYDLMQGVRGQFNAASQVDYAFRRAPSFFDEVCYTGNGTSGATQNHNLGVVPELVILKCRSAVQEWRVMCAYYNGGSSPWSYRTALNTTGGISAGSGVFNDTAPTASVFTLGNNAEVNDNGSTYVAYLFATCAGVSKVGSYTGTGTTKQIDCGFTGGARFVLIKRTDSTGDWYVWDSARGIVAGNDPYLLLNSTAAEVTNTDYVDTYSAGFEISSTAPAAINASGGTFIFLAIA